MFSTGNELLVSISADKNNKTGLSVRKNKRLNDGASSFFPEHFGFKVVLNSSIVSHLSLGLDRLTPSTEKGHVKFTNTVE